MKYKVTVLLIIGALFAMNGQMKKWTLEECVTYAVDNNLTIEQFELDYEAATIDKSDAIGNLLPNLNANASASNNVGFSIVPGSNAPTTESTFRAGGGFSSNLTLYNGLRNIKQVQRAKLNAIASQYRLDNLKDDIRLNVALAYLQVLSNKEALKVSRAQYAVTEQDLKRINELVESGVSPRGDLLEIQATAANQEQQIVNGESSIIISRVNLAQLLQITDYDNFDIVDESFEVPPSDILNNSAKVIFDKALTFRNEIKIAQSSVDLASKDVEIAKGAYAPTLSGFFNYNTGYSNRNQIPDASGIFFRPSFIDQLWIFDQVSYGARLNIPIFNGFSIKNNVQRSKISLKRAELQLEQDKLALEATVQQRYVDVKTFEKAYEAAQKTVEARRLAYNYAKERFDVGLMDSFTFSQAQSRVDNAEADVIRTKYDYIFRLKILEFYFGIPLSLD